MHFATAILPSVRNDPVSCQIPVGRVMTRTATQSAAFTSTIPLMSCRKYIDSGNSRLDGMRDSDGPHRATGAANHASLIICEGKNEKSAAGLGRRTALHAGWLRKPKQ